MNRVLVVFSDGLLSELDSARGLVSRSAWIRQAVEDKMMKEAVAPLVPDGEVQFFSRESAEAYSGPVVVTRRGIRPEDIVIPEPKPKARRKKDVQAKFDAITPIPCTCGGRIYQIGSRKGQCSGCGSPKPLKEPT